MASYEVRGPDPDGDWFVVEIDGEEEICIEETYATQEAAEMVASRLNGAIA